MDALRAIAPIGSGASVFVDTLRDAAFSDWSAMASTMSPDGMVSRGPPGHVHADAFRDAVPTAALSVEVGENMLDSNDVPCDATSSSWAAVASIAKFSVAAS
mmetsp:Transcript_105444/g.193311  ORF Transcript_105444/g.193311 Transcript_105444/m.193311 type:complete len:102 (+) Transcript_105444:188-493(+)